MNIVLYNSAPSVEEWKFMRKLGNWPICDEKCFEMAIKNSLHFVSVYNCQQIIGMGRVVGDSVLCFYLHDIIVDPAYRKKGIGTEIVTNLLTYIKKNACPNATILLMAHKGSEDFYRSFGFISRPNDIKGSGMYMPNNNYIVKPESIELNSYIIKYPN